MADDVKLTVRVNADTGQLEVLGASFTGISEKAQKAQGAFKGLSSEATSLLKSFLPFATAGGIAAFFTTAVRGAEEENEAIRRLSFALEASGVSWAKNKDAVLLWATAMQGATRFSDTEAISALERLVRVTGNLQQAQSGSQLAMGLSVQSGKSLQETTGVLIDLLNGNQLALREVNREFGAFTGGAKNTQAALDALQAQFGGAAFNEEDLTKSTHSLKNAFNDFQETIGRAFIPALTKIFDFGTQIVGMFDNLGTVIANLAAKTLVASEAIATALGRAFRGNFDGAKKAFDEMSDKMAAIEEASVQMVAQSEAQKTAATAVRTETQTRLVADASRQQTEEEKRQRDLIAQYEDELDQKLSALGDESFAKKQAMLLSEITARRNKINREITDETAKTRLLLKLEDERVKRSQILATQEARFKTATALEVASISVQALETLNNMSELKSKEDARRAKFLLALEKSIAIAKAISGAAGKGPAGIAIAAAETALIVAQFAQQSRAIDQAQSASAAGATSLSVQTPLPGGSDLTTTFGNAPPGGGAPVGGGSFVGGGAPAGGGAGVIIQVGGIVVNFSAETVDLQDARQVARRLAEAVRSGVIEGVQLAISVRDVGERNSNVAV